MISGRFPQAAGRPCALDSFPLVNVRTHAFPGREIFELERVPGENVVTSASSRKRTSKKKSSKASAPIVASRSKPLSVLTDEALRGYFKHLNGHKPCDLYQLVLSEVERPLLRAVLNYTNGNQSEAAEVLGINRGTLRKKLRTYKLTAE